MSCPDPLAYRLDLRQTQRAFAALLDRARPEPADIAAARRSLMALDHAGRGCLTRWLAWQLFTRNALALTRIERVDARLAAAALDEAAQQGRGA